MSSERQLWICGDIHGELSGLVRNSVNRGISCADILVVGDFGAGFGRPKSMDVAYSRVCASLEKMTFAYTRFAATMTTRRFSMDCTTLNGCIFCRITA